MSIESERRQAVRQIMHAALRAVNPATAVRSYFQTQPELVAQIKNAPGRLIVVGAGKAGAPMAAVVSEIFGDTIAAGRVVVKYGHAAPNSHINGAGSTPRPPALAHGLKILEAGHPVPDQAGLSAAGEIVRLLAEAGEADIVLCLISGGGSALLTLPADGLTLDDLQATTKSLLAAGATINQINTLRKHLSAVKGGRLAQIAAPAPVHTLILSDVVGDPLAVIASGPTVPDPSTFADAWAVVEQFRLADALPEAVLARLRAGCTGDFPTPPNRATPSLNESGTLSLAAIELRPRPRLKPPGAPALTPNC